MVLIKTRHLAAAFLLSGCCSAGSGAPPTKAPPKVVEAQLVALPAQGRSSCSGMFVDESFQIGEYPISNVRRGGQTTKGFNFKPWTKRKVTSAFSYTVEADGVVMKGACRDTSSRATSWDGSISSSDGLGQRETSSYDFFECSCSASGTDTLLEISGTGDFQGVFITMDDHTHHLKKEGTVHIAQLEGAPWLAVSRAKPGGLWLDPVLDEPARARLSCVVAGWMLR